MSATAIAVDDLAILEQLVVRHEVCREVVPIWNVPVGGGLGFEVDLFSVLRV